MALQVVGPDDMPPLWPEDEATATLPAGPLVKLYDGAWLAEPLPELEYLVPEMGLVAGGGAPHLVAGYGYSGKTVALQSMLLSLASGAPVWGVYKCKKRRVAHLDLDGQGERLTRRRYQRLARHMGINLTALGDTIGTAILPPIRLTEQHAEAWEEVMTGRDLVLVDSLRAASAGQDENSSDIRIGLDMLASISEKTKCRALVLHHARKMNDDDPGGAYVIRGSGAIFDACDGAFVFSAKKGEPVSVENPKARSNGDTVEDFSLVIGDVELDGDPKAGLRVAVHGKELIEERREAAKVKAREDRGRRDGDKLKAFLGNNPGAGTKEIRGVLGFSGDRLAAVILELGCVDVRVEQNGKVRVARHFLRSGGRVD
jgi:hypothetical protein